MQVTRLDVNDLLNYMQVHGIPGEIMHLSTPTPTVEATARAVCTRADQIIKSILFMVDGRPVLAIANGLSSIKRQAIAKIYGVSKGKVRLASSEMVLEISGYEVGAMPPFGHRQALTTLVDKKVLDFSEAYAGGGAENALLRLNPQDIVEASGAMITDLQD